jgi:hypothetical protein
MAANITGTSSSFLLLPGEIRASIYKALFKNYKVTIESQWHLFEGSPTTSADHIGLSFDQDDFVESKVSSSSSLVILSTCNTVHDEAITYLSTSATLELTRKSAPEQQLASLLPPQYLQCLKVVDLCDSFEMCSDHLYTCLQELPALQRVELANHLPYFVFERLQRHKDLPSDVEIVTSLLDNPIRTYNARNEEEPLQILQKERQYAMVLHAQIVLLDRGPYFCNVGGRENILFLVCGRPPEDRECR